MVELGFGGSIGLGFNGGDVRSVIKNATKDVNMSESKDKTIVNKDELNSKKIDKKINQEKPKVTPFNGGIPGVGNLAGGSLGGINNNGVDLNQYRGNKVEGNTTKQDTTKTDEVKTDSKKSSPVNIFGNNFTGIDGITKNVSGIEGTMVTPEQMQKQREQINLRKEQTVTALSAFDDLVQSIDGSIKRGEEDRLTIENIRRAFPEFESLNENQIYDLVRGVYNANKLGNEYSLYDFAVKHPELYIEFNSGKDLGMNGKADLLEAMFSPDSGTYDRPGLLKILTMGLAPDELGTLEGVSLNDAETGKEGKTFLQNAYKSLWNAVALTYNFINHPYESVKGLGNMILSFGTSRALKKAAEDAGVSRDEWVNMLIDEMGDGTSFKDKITKWMINSGNMGELTRDYFRTTYGTADGFANYVYTDPAGVLSDIISLVEAGVGLAGKAGLIEKASMKSAMKTLSWMDPYQAPGKILMGSDDVVKIGGKQIKNVGVIPELAKIEGKAAKGVLKTTGKVSKRVMEFVANKMTGLSEESRKFIKENPDLAMSYIKGEMGAEDIISKIQKEFNDIVGEKKKVGEFYEFMKNNENVKVKTNGIVSEVKGMLKDLGIKVTKDGTLEFGKLSYSPAQQRQLQQVYGYINALQDLGNNASVKDVRRARQLIDGLANWEGNSRQGLDAEVMNSIRSMRGKVDDALKEQVKGFKEADGEYKALLTSIKELKRDWFNKDGTVKDNIGSKVRNLTNKANEKKLERLEKYIPDIRQNAQALGVAEAVDKATKMNVGQYLQQGLMGGGLMALLSGNITGKAIFSFLGILGVATPKNFVRVLSKIGKGEEWVKNVGDRIMNGLKLSKEQEDSVIKLLDRNKEEIMANPEKYIDIIEEGEYAKGQSKAYLGAESTEKKLSEKERASLIKKYAKGSKNNGFVMDVVKGMGEGEHGMADLDNKLIKLEENLGDTTAQHEFFHALFSVIDEDTKKYVLDEAKHYLGLTDDKYKKLGKEEASKIMNNAAEEWLAESFGIYARRKEIKLGEIKLKGNRLQRFKSRVRDLFQRAYEWIQDYSMDRKTINKLFNEVYGAVDGKVLDETGKFNLAEKLGINEKNAKLGVNENGLRYKKTGNLKKNGYTTTNGQEDRLLLGGLAATEGGMKQATHAEGGRGNRGPQKAHLERVSSSDTANFFEHTDNKGNYIEFNNGGGKTEKIYKGGDMFDGYSEKLNKGLNKYKENLLELRDEMNKNNSKDLNKVIGKTKHGKEITISKQGLRHIYEKHGAIDFNTLINAINDPTNQKQEFRGGRYRFEVRLDDGDTLVVGLQPKEKMGNGKVRDVNSRVDADLYSITSVTKGKPRGAESLEVRLKRDAKKAGNMEGADYNSNNLYGKLNQNGLTKKEGGNGMSLGNGGRGIKGLQGGETKIGGGNNENNRIGGKRQMNDNGGSYGGMGTSTKSVKARAEDMEKLTNDLKSKNPKGAFVDTHSVDEYKTYKNFSTDDKKGLISVKEDGDIINFVTDGTPGKGKELMFTAIENGGNKMDNYGKGLVNYYERFGFEPVARVKFNREYAPNNWNFVRDGEPDIFVMKHNGDSVDVVREKYGTYKHKTPEELDKLPVMEYDDALKYRDELQAKEGKGLRYKKAYHGSPADFDKFDMEHMGEGEGGASHGWGLYFAKDKNIAKERYAERSHKYGISYEGGTLEEIKKKADEKGFYNLDIKDRVAYRLMNETKGDNMFNRFVDFDSAKEKSLSLIDDKISLAEYVINNKGKDSITDKIYNEAMDSLPKLKEEKKVISNMKNGDFGIGEAKDRNLYEVNIPDEIKKDTPTGSNYFRESRTYNKQELGAILEKFKEKYPDKYDLLKNKFNTPLHGRRVYTSIADVLGGQKQASKFLESIGYDGVYAKGYIDKDVYVLFNDNAQIQNHIRYKKDYNWNREDMKKELVKRANEGFYDDLKKEYDGFLDDVTKNSGGYPVKAPLKYGSHGVDFSEKGKKGNRILDKGVNKKGGLNDVNDIVRGTIRVSNLNDIDKVVNYVKKNYKNVTDFDDKYRNPTPMGYVDYSFLYEGKNGAKAEVQVNVTEMIVAKEKLKDALNYGITEKEYNDIAKRSGTKGGGLGHTFYDEIRMIRKKLDEKGLSSNERKMLLGRIKVLSKQSVDYYKSYMDLVKGKL